MLHENAFPSTLAVPLTGARGYLVLPAKPTSLRRVPLVPFESEVPDPRCTRPCCRPDPSLEGVFNWLDRVVGAC
jgi:hypothetical protein